MPPPRQSPPQTSRRAPGARPQPGAPPCAPPARTRPWAPPLHPRTAADATPTGKAAFAKALETPRKRSRGWALGAADARARPSPAPAPGVSGSETCGQEGPRVLAPGRDLAASQGRGLGTRPPWRAPGLWWPPLCGVRPAPAFEAGFGIDVLPFPPPTVLQNLQSTRIERQAHISQTERFPFGRASWVFILNQPEVGEPGPFRPQRRI